MEPTPLTEKQKRCNSCPFIKNKWDYSLYRSIDMAIQRCTNPNNKGFHRYGSRGIKWKFGKPKEAFFVLKNMYYAVCRKYPDDVITINRIDNDGNYEKGNVEFVPRWINSKQRQKDNPISGKNHHLWGKKHKKKTILKMRLSAKNRITNQNPQTQIPY